MSFQATHLITLIKKLKATEENKRQNGGHTAGIGGSWAVQDGQDYNSWKKAQNDFDNFKRQNSEVIQQ